MTLVSNDPIWWPTIASFRVSGYFVVGSSIAVLYDWGLTFGEEFELIWTQRWSLMTALYLTVRYTGIPYNVLVMLSVLLSAPKTDESCTIIYFVREWINVIVNIVLSVIMIARLHAMYQQSRKILTILTLLCLAIQITCVVIVVIQNKYISAEELILSGINICEYSSDGDLSFLFPMTWVLGTAWEVLALSLAVWIAVKHFRELQRPSTGWAVGDCFTILMQTHVFYFASFSFNSFLRLSSFSPTIANLNPVGTEIYGGFLQITAVLQMFVLGPRLILGVREYHAKLVANFDEGGSMASVVFQEHVQITTGDGV